MIENQYEAKKRIRQRMTPTFYHHNIFNYQQQDKQSVRVTPTFESTVFNIDGYQIQTNHSRTLKKHQSAKNIEPCVYRNESKERKQASLYPLSVYGYAQTVKTSRANDQKERLAQDINQLGGRTSRLRKCVQQMSNPIFGGYSWTPFAYETNQQTYNPDNYRYQKQIVQQQQKRQNITPSHQQVEQTIERSTRQNQNKTKFQVKNPNKQQSKSVTKKDQVNSKHINNLKRLKSASNLSHKHKR